MTTSDDKKVNELVGGDMNSSGGDRNATNDSEIETGPVAKPHNDDSEYEKGVSTTTDKVFGRYRQNIPWFAVYSYGGASGGGRARIPMAENKPTKTVTKKSVEEKIDDLVKKTKNTDLTDKNYDAKLDKVLSSIKGSNFSNEQLDKIIDAASNKKDNQTKTL